MPNVVVKAMHLELPRICACCLGAAENQRSSTASHREKDEDRTKPVNYWLCSACSAHGDEPRGAQCCRGRAVEYREWFSTFHTVWCGNDAFAQAVVDLQTKTGRSATIESAESPESIEARALALRRIETEGALRRAAERAKQQEAARVAAEAARVAAWQQYNAAAAQNASAMPVPTMPQAPVHSSVSTGTVWVIAVLLLGGFGTCAVATSNRADEERRRAAQSGVPIPLGLVAPSPQQASPAASVPAPRARRPAHQRRAGRRGDEVADAEAEPVWEVVRGDDPDAMPVHQPATP